jgi:chemotaxis protein methyltransferase CheR
MSRPSTTSPAILPAAWLHQVTTAQLHQFAELIYQRTGIRLTSQKKMLLSNRLRRRLRETGIKDFGRYYRHLRSLAADDPEWDAFLQEVTTHETYLFRDEPQWEWFRGYLNQRGVAARQGKAPRSLRIWSAACSTGDEPVTAACCIAGCLPELAQWRVEILGTDIGVGALEQAKTAAFGPRAMRLVPEDFRRRFFTKVAAAEVWHPKPILTDMITYRHHNLLEPLRDRPFDLVVLRNVLIYFDPASKTTAIHHVRAAMRPGGLLMAGATENVSESLRDFQRIEPWLYQKPGP